LAKSIVPTPLSFGAGAESSREVKLQGIDTTGLRLKTKPLDDLIAKPNTSKAALSELQAGSRVFIVQEIYKATSLDLQASDKKAFSLKFNDGSAPANCQSAAQPAAKDSNAKPPSTPEKTGGATSSAQNAGAAPSKTQDGGSGATDKTKTVPQNSSAKSQPGTSDTKTPQQSNTSSQSGAPAVTGAVGICVAEDYSLKFQTKDPIPFAVRLAQLELVQGVLRRRVGAKTFVGTLGVDGEISGSLVDNAAPVIEGLTRRKH
jgi:hypothetical protein